MGEWWGVSFVAALCAPFLLTTSPSPPLPIHNTPSLPTHLHCTVNPEPAVPDRTNPKRSIKEAISTLKGQKGPSSKLVRSTLETCTGQVGKGQILWGGIRHRKIHLQHSSSWSKAWKQERRGKRLWTAKKEQRKVTGMIRWEGELWTNFMTLFFFNALCHTLPPNNTADSAVWSSWLCLCLPLDWLML